MAMEHRWGRRIAVDLNATLYSPPLGRLRGRLRNISSGGAFMQVPADLTINTRAELVFSAEHDTTTHIHRLDTVVSRSTADGVGLMFLQFDPKALSALLQRLDARASPRRAAARSLAPADFIMSNPTKEAK